MEDDFFTIKEAATRLSVNEPTIKKWIKDRILRKVLKWSRGYTERQPSYLIPLEGNERIFHPKPQGQDQQH